MQRRRSTPHTFEGNIAAERAKLEAELAKLKPGLQMDALRKKIRQLDGSPHERMAFVAGTTAAETGLSAILNTLS